MRIFSLIDPSDGFNWGLICVNVSIFIDDEIRGVLHDEMYDNFQIVAEKIYKNGDYVDAHSLIQLICVELEDMGYLAERVFITEIDIRGYI